MAVRKNGIEKKIKVALKWLASLCCFVSTAKLQRGELSEYCYVGFSSQKKAIHLCWPPFGHIVFVFFLFFSNFSYVVSLNVYFYSLLFPLGA